MTPAPDPLELALDLVNSWDELETPPELLRDVAVVERWLRRLGYVAAADAVTPADLPRLRRLRARLRGAFEARDEDEAVALLNGVVREGAPVPQLVRRADSWELEYAVRFRTATQAIAPLAALALLDAVHESGWDRFGICAAAPCCCVYVDRSRNKSRLYCCELCADRVSQAAYRRRKKGAP